MLSKVEWDTVNGGTREGFEGDDRIWRAPDMMATEYEVSAFIGALVKMIKPRVSVETGCYDGQTTLLIAANTCGTVYSCDVDIEKVYSLRSRVPSNVILTVQTGISLIRSIKNVDFAFLDSGADRSEEAEALDMAPHGIVALHDSKRGTKAIKELGYACIDFNTPRGIALFQKLP